MFDRKALILILGLLIAAPSYGETVPLSEITASDRILIIAPHPDDEILGSGILLQRAKKAGAAVKVLYLTNGESNEVSALFYQKRPLLLRSDFVKNGDLRKKEAEAVLESLGYRKEDLIFFGYPDGGLMNIWLKYWGSAKSYRSIFTRIRKVPYKDTYSYGHAYKGDEILRDYEKVLLSFMPNRIFVTAPFDLHQDHQAAYLYLQAALSNLAGQLQPPPQVHLYLVHAHQWPFPKKYLPGDTLDIPGHIDWDVHVRWHEYPGTPEETQKKQEAILRYKTQVSYKKNFLLAFARQNELFADYPLESLTKNPPNDAEPFEGAPRPGDTRYEFRGEELWVEIPITGQLDEMGLSSYYLFPYHSGFLFSEMPKLSFKLFGNKLFAFDGFKNIHDPGLIYKIEKDRVLLRIPARLLKDPDYLYVCVRNIQEELSLDFGTWRVLKMV